MDLVKHNKVGYQYCRKCDSNTASSPLYKAPKESMLGRKLLMKFNVNGKTEWFEGIVNAYRWPDREIRCLFSM